MLEIIALVVAGCAAGAAGLSIHELRTMRREMPAHLESMTAAHANSIKEMRAVVTQGRLDSARAVDQVKVAASKITKTISRKICSDCQRLVWKFDEYADGTVICHDCAYKAEMAYSKGVKEHEEFTSQSNLPPSQGRFARVGS